MKQLEPEIKRVYQKLITIFLMIAITALTLQLTGGKQWAALIPKLIEQGEIWRLLSAHFIHINWNHFAMNLAGAALCMAVFRLDVPAQHWLISAILISLFSSLLLYTTYSPMQSYVGFSDTLHGWIVIGVLAMLTKEPKLALTMLFILVSKLLYENFIEPPSADLLEGSRVATESHLFGALGGLIYSLSYNQELRSTVYTYLTKNVQKKSDPL